MDVQLDRLKEVAGTGVLRKRVLGLRKRGEWGNKTWRVTEAELKRRKASGGVGGEHKFKADTRERVHPTMLAAINIEAEGLC